MRRIAVIGAGIAGLSAARALVRHGFEVEVWDKGSRPGGRTCSRRREEFAFDHGAQYFTARGAGFRARVRKWAGEGVVGRWNPRIRNFGPDEARGRSEPPERYVGTPSMGALACHLARDLDVRRRTRVERLERESRGSWRLLGESGNSLSRADAVLVTTPPRQAVPLLEGAPELALRVSRVTLRPCWAALLGFAELLDLDFDAAFVNEGPLSWIARNSSKPGRPPGEAWVLHGTPEWSEQNLEMESHEAADALRREFFNLCVSRKRVPVAFAEAHRWRWAIPQAPLDAPCLYDETLQVGVAGDWCGGPRIEGAHSSGMALAERLRGHAEEADE